MEDDIQNYLSTVMFRGTPCILSLTLIQSDISPIDIALYL